MQEEYDASRLAWSYYRKVYLESHWKLIKEFDIENVCTWDERQNKTNKNELRYLAYIKHDSLYIKYWGSEFTLSGDCLFNFNKKKCVLFSQIIGKEIDDRGKKALRKLNRCKTMHYSEWNLALMPATGSLNNFKGKVSFDKNNQIYFPDKTYSKYAHDRLDTFLVCLDNYFKTGNDLVFSCCSFTNLSCIKSFLTNFNHIYDYCDKMYFLNDKIFVDALLKSGRKPIITLYDLECYMDLALEYWGIRKTMSDI